ncbi:MAG: rod shape-determining protein MreC [Desulfovibrionaceae bacterium]
MTSVLRPGQWVRDRVVGFWERYVYLVGVREENETLARERDSITWELNRNREAMNELERLRDLFSLVPPPQWRMTGARVVAHRMGPYAALDTIVLNKGFASGAQDNAPVATPRGVVGRVLRESAHASSVLLLTDPNSRIAVRGRTNRTAGILAGKGPTAPLDVLYVPLNEPLEEGEILVTSGLAGIYPAGLPVARVVSIERSDISLFQTVHATPLVAIRDVEEVVLMLPPEDFPPEAPAGTVSGGDGEEAVGVPSGGQ